MLAAQRGDAGRQAALDGRPDADGERLRRSPTACVAHGVVRKLEQRGRPGVHLRLPELRRDLHAGADGDCNTYTPRSRRRRHEHPGPGHGDGGPGRRADRAADRHLGAGRRRRTALDRRSEPDGRDAGHADADRVVSRRRPGTARPVSISPTSSRAATPPARPAPQLQSGGSTTLQARPRRHRVADQGRGGSRRRATARATVSARISSASSSLTAVSRRTCTHRHARRRADCRPRRPRS